jgi:hypothetical protein
MADEPTEPPSGDVAEDSPEDSGSVTTKVAAASLGVTKKGKVRKLGRVGENCIGVHRQRNPLECSKQPLSQALISATKP